MICMVFNPLKPHMPEDWLFHNMHENHNTFFAIKVYTTCDKECVMATHVPNSIDFHYT